MKIIIKANCSPEDSKRCFDGLDCQENFSEYFNDVEINKLVGIVTGGYMRFEFDEKESILFVITEYQTLRKLTPKEERELISYTQGQWSDGIGEGFEQRDFDEDMYNPSPWYPGQKITLTYES